MDCTKSYPDIAKSISITQQQQKEGRRNRSSMTGDLLREEKQFPFLLTRSFSHLDAA